MKIFGSNRYIAKKIADFIGVLILIFVILFIWQLYRSPIPLQFLKPYIIKALNHDNADFEVTVERVDLELVRSVQPIKIIAKNVVYRKVDNRIEINAPRISISFSIRALIRGIISPSSIEIERPNIRISTTYNGEQTSKEVEKYSLNEKKIGFYFDAFESFMDRFNSSDMSYPESYINSIRIKDAEFEYFEVDYNRKWVFNNANFFFYRHTSYIDLGLNAIMDLGDVKVPTNFDVKFFPQTNKINLDFTFKDLKPSNVVDNFMSYKDENSFYRIDLPVSGKLNISINFNEILANKNKVSRSLDTAITKFDFAFEGGEGKIAFSENEDLNYNISSFLLRGNIDSGLNNIKIENADFKISDKRTLLGLNIEGIKDLILYGSVKNIKITLKANIEELPLSQLTYYWPRFIAEDAWLWVKNGIYSGNAKNAEFEFDFAYNKETKRIGFVKLAGVAYVEDASLNYLDGMPHVNNIYGKATFFNDKINIEIDKGVSDGNIVNGGHVILYDLNKDRNFIDIRLLVKSAIPDVLRLINHPPLMLAKEIELDPDSISGNADATVGLKFELKKDLLADDVNLNVVSKVRDVKIRDIIKNKVITSDELDLMVDNTGISIIGNINVGDIGMSVEWKKEFKPPYRNLSKIALFADNSLLEKLGMESRFLKEPYLYGKAQIIGNITEEKGRILAEIRADLTNTAINFNSFGFIKKRGDEGRVNFNVNIVDGELKSIDNIELAKKDFLINGSVEMVNGAVRIVNITNISAFQIDAKAKIDLGDGSQPIKVNISGNNYNISPLFDSGFSFDNAPGGVNANNANIRDVPNIDINIAVNSLWTNKDVPITNFAGSVSLRRGIGINEIKLVGNYSYRKDTNFKFEYSPRCDGEHIIDITSNDAGKTLRVLRLYDHMVGGNLSISAKRDSNGIIIGYARIRNFSLINTNILSRVLSLASLSGMLNMLRGDGIVFSHFDASFTFEDGILKIEDAKAFGNVIGITANGKFNYNNGNIKFNGLIAPAYSINRFFARIPIIGRLLSGEEKTIFAANYRVRGNISNPDISINPLSAISPNSLRGLFSGTRR